MKLLTHQVHGVAVIFRKLWTIRFLLLTNCQRHASAAPPSTVSYNFSPTITIGCLI
jgi:hypothetical protein